MSTIIAIDPGLRVGGRAVFRNGLLVQALLFHNPDKESRGPGAWASMAREVVGKAIAIHATLVIEVPKIYQGSKQKGDPDDILQVAGVVGAIAAATQWHSIQWIHPRDWKGTVSPDVMIQRIQWLDPKTKLQPRLSHAEFDTLQRPRAVSLEHNLWDAIGIGLHHLGRLKPNKGSDT